MGYTGAGGSFRLRYFCAMWRAISFFFVSVFLWSCQSKSESFDVVAAKIDQLNAELHDPALWIQRDTTWWAASAQRIKMLDQQLYKISTRDHTLKTAVHTQRLRCQRLHTYLNRCRRTPLLYDPLLLLAQVQHTDTADLLLKLPHALTQARLLLADSLLAPLPASWSLNSVTTANRLLHLIPAQAQTDHPATQAWLAWIEFMAWVNSKSAGQIRDDAVIKYG